jgi:hydrogenase/urease accessory protein HupE
MKTASAAASICVVFQFLFLSLAHAHDPGLSTATVTVAESDVDLILGLARADALALVNPNLKSLAMNTPADWQKLKTELETVAATDCRLYFQGKPATPLQVLADRRDQSNIEILLRFRPTAGRDLRFETALLERLPTGHRQFLTVKTTSGEELGETMLSAKKSFFDVKLPTQSGTADVPHNSYSFVAFLKLGIEHILTGYDHLLFLFGLMLVCRNPRSVLAVITCFTVAHSITLALAVLDIVRLPGRIVEPLIAASIAYVGIENFVRGDAPKWRTIITFGFGLVHGLGFADALRELGVSSGQFGFVVPLVGFNLGVEVGQLSVAAVVLPILWKLRTSPAFLRRWVPACSVAVAFAGSYWLVERVLQN